MIQAILNYVMVTLQAMPPGVAPDFWDFKAPHLIMLLAMLGGFIVWFSKFEGRMSSAIRAIEVLSKQTDKTFTEQQNALRELVERINRIDDMGTRKSQQAILSDERILSMQSARLETLEKINQEWIPKVASMARDVHWIVQYIETNGLPRKTKLRTDTAN